MEYLSLCIANRMCITNVISEDDKEFYAYSVQLLLEKSIGIAFILLFAIASRKLIEISVFLIVFSLIRIHSDGIHCKSSLGCFVSSVIISLSTIPVSSLLMISPGKCQGGVILSMIFIFCIGTIRNPNLDPTEQELNHLKKCSRIGIMIIGLLVLIFTFLLPQNHLVYYSALGVIYNAVSLMIVKLKGEEEPEDE